MAIPFKEIMERDKLETFDYHNFDSWSKLDFEPKIINFLEIENENDNHGQLVRTTYKDVAPSNSNAYLGNVTYRVKGDEVLFCNINYYGAYIPIEQFVRELDIHIIGASLSMKSDSLPEPLIAFLKTLPVIYVGSAGNDSYRGITGKFKHLGLMSGAIYLDNGEIRKESYSAVGEMMDFATLHSWAEGTSFSSPVLAGITAWIIAKYGVMPQAKMKELLISLSIDAGEKGHDTYFGHGVPILPEDGKIDMLEEKNMADNKLYTVDEIIEKLKKYDKSELHIHHTWKPNLNDFNGLNHVSLQNGMRNYHINERDFIDIAQHVTQFPDGKFMIGRDFAEYPNSASGYRPDGSHWNRSFVFMIENIGNFDTEEIPKVMWDNNVKLGAYFVENGGTVLFHNQMDKSKSCPGTKFKYDKYIEDVVELIKNENHWAEKHFDSLNNKGIVIHEKRFDANITRGEVFALLDRIVK